MPLSSTTFEGRVFEYRYSEAAAFGLPAFTYDTGGLANYVINGISGYRLPLSATSEDFAERIKEVIRRNEFRKLYIGSRSLYMNKTSWKVWSHRFPDMIESHIEKRINRQIEMKGA